MSKFASTQQAAIHGFFEGLGLGGILIGAVFFAHYMGWLP